jgi:hypothetical protein
MQLKHGYFLKYHTNRASEVPNKAAEKDLLAVKKEVIR